MEGGDGWIKTSLHFLIKGCNDNICQGRISFFAQYLFIFNNSSDGERECRRERQVVV